MSKTGEKDVKSGEKPVKKKKGKVGVGQGIGGGRKPKYTPKTLMEAAEEYFDECEKTLIDKGIGGSFSKPKTLSGLCLHIGVSKDYISEKAKDKKFAETIKEIRLVVENCIEEGILYGHLGATAGIFNLKNNFGWKDIHGVEGPDGKQLIGSVIMETVIRK